MRQRADSRRDRPLVLRFGGFDGFSKASCQAREHKRVGIAVRENRLASGSDGLPNAQYMFWYEVGHELWDDRARRRAQSVIRRGIVLPS